MRGWFLHQNRIQDIVLRWQSCVRDLRFTKAREEAQADLGAEMNRDVQIVRRRLNFKLELLAGIIFTEATEWERGGMPMP